MKVHSRTAPAEARRQVPNVRRPVPVPVSTHESRSLTSERLRRRNPEGVDLFPKLVSIGFWGTLASLIIGAAAFAGFMVLFMLPLLSLGYLVFCLIAATGNREVE